MNKHPQLTTLVEFESELTRKLKASYRSRTEKLPEPYYYMLMAGYLGDTYKKKK